MSRNLTFLLLPLLFWLGCETVAPDSPRYSVSIKLPKTTRVKQEVTLLATPGFASPSTSKYVWKFGDTLVTSKVGSIRYRFSNIGNQDVTVLLFDTLTTKKLCEATTTIPVLPIITQSSDTAAIFETVRFLATWDSLPAKHIFEYRWRINGDSQMVIGKSDSVSLQFRKLGSNSISVILFDRTSGSAHDSATTTVYVKLPTLTIIPSSLSASRNSPISVSSKVSPTIPTHAYDIRWNYGDGSPIVNSLNGTSHVYSIPGKYLLSAALYIDSVLMVSRSFSVAITGDAPNISLKDLSGFSKVRIQFDGDNSSTGCVLYCDMGDVDLSHVKYHFSALSWKDDSGASNTPNGPSTSCSTSYRGQVSIKLSTDYRSIDSLFLTQIDKYDLYLGTVHRYSEDRNIQLRADDLALVLASADSVQFARLGPSLSQHLAYSHKVGQSVTSGGGGGCSGQYISTDWNSTSIPPKLTVTLYK